MTFLPIVARELRAASRRRWTYWGRFGAALLAVVAGSAIWLIAGSTDPREIGAALFKVLTGLAFIGIPILGIQLTCGCLSTERREGTLGLLFLTDLRGYDVVFGKLAATSLHAAYSLLAALPVLAIPMLLGGVAGAEFWRIALVAANLLFFFLSVGMFSSSVCREDHRALALAVFIGVATVVAAPLLDTFWSRLHPQIHLPDWWSGIPSPAFGCVAAFDANYIMKGYRAAFWWNALVTQLYSWGCLMLACRIVSRSWQETAAGPKRGEWRDLWRAMTRGSAGARAAARRKWLEVNPFLWRAGHRRDKHIAPWLFLALAAAVWFAGGKLAGNNYLFDEPYDFVCANVVQFLFEAWVASEACRCFAEDRRSGALELLLTTPLGAEQIVRGQRKAIWRQFAAPVAAVLLVDLLFMGGYLRHTIGRLGRLDRQVLVLFYLLPGPIFVVDMYAISWLSMKLGLTGRKPIRVIMLCLWWTVFLPGLVTLGSEVLYINRTFWNQQTSIMILLWAVPSLTAGLIVFAAGRYNILKRFRDGTLQRAGTLPPAALAR
jgi:ABC-type transport system involved in multi-copper enzyme maturation permease subunit